MLELNDSEDIKKEYSNRVIIKAKDLKKVYGELIALEDLTFNVKEGEIFCLIGPNGAGKSTFVKLLTGQIKPTSGTLMIDNLNPIKDRKRLLGSFGLVPQEIALYKELTGYENLEFHGRLYGMSKLNLKKRINEMLNISGLEKRKDDKVSTYSGGMRRRLQLVRAMLHVPRILILDEPTLGVDVQSRNAIHQYILELTNKGMTIILTTNYMEEAERLADRILILDTNMVSGPERLRKIQENVFPHTIFEFKMKNDQIPENFTEEFLKKELGADIYSKKKLNEEETIFRIKLQSENLHRLLENFLAKTRIQSIRIDEFVLKKPTLEDIFLKLTGKELRE